MTTWNISVVAALAEERADRLRATLRGVFHREHSTDLPVRLADQKEFREYLDSLRG